MVKRPVFRPLANGGRILAEGNRVINIDSDKLLTEIWERTDGNNQGKGPYIEWQAFEELIRDLLGDNGPLPLKTTNSDIMTVTTTLNSEGIIESAMFPTKQFFLGEYSSPYLAPEVGGYILHSPAKGARKTSSRSKVLWNKLPLQRALRFSFTRRNLVFFEQESAVLLQLLQFTILAAYYNFYCRTVTETTEDSDMFPFVDARILFVNLLGKLNLTPLAIAGPQVLAVWKAALDALADAGALNVINEGALVLNRIAPGAEFFSKWGELNAKLWGMGLGDGPNGYIGDASA